LINGKPPAVRAKFQQESRSGAEFNVSSISIFELWYGVSKSKQFEGNIRKLQSFLAGPVSVLPFEEEDSSSAGELRATTKRAGKPIGAYDLLIARQAVRRKLTLITANVREFSRVPALSWQDWASTK
jgi:tRNA(fMet)-specific endonuclease VapC